MGASGRVSENTRTMSAHLTELKAFRTTSVAMSTIGLSLWGLVCALSEESITFLIAPIVDRP